MSELGTHVRRGCNTRMRRAWSDLAVAGAATGPLVFGAALVALFAACYDNPTAPMLPRPPAPRKSVAGPMGVVLDHYTGNERHSHLRRDLR
jgi:hypothetical protein